MQKQERDALMKNARAALEGAYSVYSKFSVGAAVLLENGEIVRGSNQENSAYPSGMCAERVALYYACAAHPGIRVRAVAITARDGSGQRVAVTPCGACRQVMEEIIRRYGTDFEVIMEGDGEPRVVSASALLPLPFAL
jgi:cytidine deaminase